MRQTIVNESRNRAIAALVAGCALCVISWALTPNRTNIMTVSELILVTGVFAMYSRVKGILGWVLGVLITATAIRIAIQYYRGNQFDIAMYILFFLSALAILGYIVYCKRKHIINTNKILIGTLIGVAFAATHIDIASLSTWKNISSTSDLYAFSAWFVMFVAGITIGYSLLLCSKPE